MSSVVLVFPQALRRVADLDEPAFLRRVRLTARARGCNGAKALAVESEARKLLGEGMSRVESFAKCEFLASELGDHREVINR